MSVVYLGLGSNLGDRAKNIQDALGLLAKFGIQILKVSSIIETSPVGGPPQGLFLNAAVKVETSLPPLKLLGIINQIESLLGRVRTIPNAPRPMDIDILLYEDVIMNDPVLVIPHPRMNERDFVMQPLNEIRECNIRVKSS